MLFEYRVTLLMRFYQISKEKSIFSLKIEFLENFSKIGVRKL